VELSMKGENMKSLAKVLLSPLIGLTVVWVIIDSWKFKREEVGVWHQKRPRKFNIKNVMDVKVIKYVGIAKVLAKSE
jgi:hypothetical protein